MENLTNGALVTMFFIFMMFIISMIIINGIGLFGYFRATGYEKQSWKAFVPYFNYHQVLILAGMNPILILLIIFGSLIPVIGSFIALYLVIVAHYRMYSRYSGQNRAMFATLFILIPFASLIYHLIVLNKPENIINASTEEEFEPFHILD